jgi:hypothetical protein
MNNYLKYLKYKQKYLDLKNLNLNGGNNNQHLSLVGGHIPTEWQLGFDDGYIGYNRYSNDKNYNIDYHKGRQVGINAIDYQTGFDDYNNRKENRKINKEYKKGYEDASSGSIEY